MDKNNELAIPDEIIKDKIYFIRGQKVMIDRDLAELYGVETKQLKRAVRRNINRFPEDFMFQMSKEELENWRYQFGTSNSDKMGLRYPPFCFTEQGVAMLSSVLNSDLAIMVNIRIIRIFTKIRNMLSSHKEILLKLEQIERKNIEYDEKFNLIFEYLKQLEEKNQETEKQKNRKQIGF
ncbi:MAG: ORF6N domain-containing protein [Bacteroidales bacterium]|nr:ORF6N domain-containing protein [Bacteroidales bacterium]